MSKFTCVTSALIFVSLLRLTIIARAKRLRAFPDIHRRPSELTLFVDYYDCVVLISRGSIFREFPKFPGSPVFPLADCCIMS